MIDCLYVVYVNNPWRAHGCLERLTLDAEDLACGQLQIRLRWDNGELTSLFYVPDRQCIEHECGVTYPLSYSFPEDENDKMHFFTSRRLAKSFRRKVLDEAREAVLAVEQKIETAANVALAALGINPRDYDPERRAELEGYLRTL